MERGVKRPSLSLSALTQRDEDPAPRVVVLELIGERAHVLKPTWSAERCPAIELVVQVSIGVQLAPTDK